MGSLLHIVGVVLAAGALAKIGFDNNQQLSRYSRSYAAAWHAEYRLRLCGRLAAAERNLAEAAAVLGHAAAAAAATRLVDDLQAPYTPAAWPPHDGDCVSAAPSDSMPVVGASELYLQQHDNQPAVWPNWTVRYVHR